MIGQIEITGAPLEAIVRAAYSPSTPRGLGHFHYQEGDLKDEEVAEIISAFAGSPIHAVSMDYIKGRSVKMRVRKDEEGRLFIGNRWYDHSDSQLRSFLKAIGLSDDLLDKARAEEDAHRKVCVAAALEFLATKGGSFVMAPTADPKDFDPLVWDGLFYGIDSKQTQVKYGGRHEGDTWTALPAPSEPPRVEP